ncbi:MAG: hypothetical protein FD163_2203 [Hyphomonadaceae bacterium]|nr:MAG: hypothetical protein FD128_1973 [Hyphomonadaceae bacterium]KAF0183483.1 MAG: hypothetical protein FD163_2203 [Hyphomonadaceae bacterium]
MTIKLTQFAYLVDEYDRAIDYFTNILGFALVSDEDVGGGKRWVVVAAGGDGAKILLAKAKGNRQNDAIGDQFGGRVGLFLETDNFEETYSRFKRNGVKFTEEPRREPYGIVAVFEDIYGNFWDLIHYAKN